MKDTFGFRIVERVVPDTRRGILSLVSAMYDPLGLAAPLVLPAKRVLQDTCKQDYGWDEEIPEEKLVRWREWLNDLPKLKNVTMPRSVKPPEFGELRSIQLHHFSDASEEGYGAVSYLRLVNATGNIHCGILMGKSRVAPLKTITIPRMELTAATVAVKLDKLIQEELTLPIHETVFWTDSTLVLQYIRNESKRFQTFVANRLAIIHDVSSPSQWRHVNSNSNPADHASRGLKACETDKLERWLKGPEFLWKDKSHWPVQPDQLPDLSQDHKELKRKRIQVHAIVEEGSLESLISRYSSWYKLQKCVAWLLRFKQYLQSQIGRFQDKHKKGHLTVDDITSATNEIIKIVQQEAFPKELAFLRSEAHQQPLGVPKMDASVQQPQLTRTRSSGKRLNDTGYVSPLRKLNPVLIDDIICVGGRLERASISFSAKHPVILPNGHHVTDLIIKHYHQSEGHVGTSQVLASVRQKFWVLRGLTAVRRVVGKCLRCRRWNARPGQQIMAPLPEARVTPEDPPFTSVGIDYFGPLLVKRGRSEVKRYGCIFTCLAVRAVHIEIAHDLSTDSFIQAFTRFVSRRGPPTVVYSDNGTNFKGAEAEIKYALEAWNHDQIRNRLQSHGVEWYFNPPGASHAGSDWERMIRSTRKILLENQLADDQTLLTLMAEVEKLLNDRPLTRQTDDPNDLEPLTPSKLLLLRSNACIPPGVITEDDKYSRRWKQAQYLANVFWKRWIKEYLPTLQTRQKWLRLCRNFAVGDLILIVDDNAPRGHWPKGIIEQVFPDRDAVVRQVIVRTATTRLRRDVRKLCLLEGNLEEKTTK